MGLEVGVEQQTMGQGWLEHRSKVRRAGPEAELVTEEARNNMSRRGTLEPHPQPHTPPHSSSHTPSSREGCVPGSSVVTDDCRSCMVPKLWLDLLKKGRLSSEALREPDVGLGVPEKQGWAGGGGEEECGAKAGRRVAGTRGGRGAWSDTYHGHMASLPPGWWGRSRARRQEVDTARELRDNRETRRETDTGEEREKDTVRGNPWSWGVTVTDRAQGPALPSFPTPIFLWMAY